MNNSKYIILAVAIGLVLLGYFYFAGSDNKEIPKQEANISDSINPKDILKYDPDAPAWMQDAESCKIVAGKIFCKMAGE